MAVWSERRLRREISRVFQNTTYPGDAQLFRMSYSERSMDWPPNEFEIFLGREWKKLDKKKLLKDPISSTFLSAEGASYFLPAAMLASFDKKSSGAISDFFETYIYDPVDGMIEFEGQDEIRRRIKEILSREQRHVVAKYIEFTIANMHDVRFGADYAPASFQDTWRKYILD